MTLVRNETQRHSAALKIAGQNPIGLLPLDGFSFTVPTFQLSSVFDAVSNRVPPSNTMSCFIGFGTKAGAISKTHSKLGALSFRFCPKGHGGQPLEVRYRRKTPALKLKCLFVCEPPAAIGSESTQAPFKQFANCRLQAFIASRGNE